MDIAGFVIGVVTAWETAVQVFEIVDSGKKYGMDYEVLRVKLEVERIRLMVWGDAVGLSEVERGRPSPDPRLNREEVRTVVLRLLGCIQHVFEHSERLQDRYGLRPVQPTIVDSQEPPTQSQFILGPIFKRAYEGLRHSARDRQRTTPLTKKTIWAVHDKKKFQTLIAEIKDLNDGLGALFPDLSPQTKQLIRTDIDQSVEIRDLQILQEATADDHEEISESASMRLETLTTIEAISQPALTVTGEDDDEEGNVTESEDVLVLTRDSEITTLENYLDKKNKGALNLSLHGPQSWSARVTANVYWDGEKQRDHIWDDRENDFVKLLHPSFDLYRGHTFMKKKKEEEYNNTSEDYILLDIESSAKYESINPGTVTVEGFGLECWAYEEKFGKPRSHTIAVSGADMPSLPAKKLLRRLDHLRRGVGKFGWSPIQDEADLKEFTGSMGITYYGNRDASTDPDQPGKISELLSLLNRTDIFADFTKSSSIAFTWSAPNQGIGLWNLLWQIIIAKELALRLEHTTAGYTGYTQRILASLTISKLWLTNVEIILEDSKINLENIAKPKTREEIDKAERLKNKGNEALKAQQYQKAVDLYTEAIEIDLSNSIYRSNRSSALMSIGRVEAAREDAIVATRLDPNYAKGWARLGFSELKQGNGKKARAAYERAIEIAGDKATALMKQGLADSKAKIDADIKAIEKETDQKARGALWKDLEDREWDILGKDPQIHSHVHQRQADGLLFFAERMKWSYINETRDNVEDAYAKLKSGDIIPVNLHDWLFGLMLPGRWTSYTIMTALIHCTPSISKEIGVADYYECGLSVPKQSYWRIRTVLGRVLGCLPGLVSMCGWIGPCPPVEFNPPLREKRPCHVRLEARPVVPIVSTDGVIYVGARPYNDTRIQPGEELEGYLLQMKDPDSWVTPQPPIKEVSTVSIKGIYLKKMPLDVKVAANKELTEQEVAKTMECRASIAFNIDDNEQPVTYVLYTNPVFVTLPACRPTGENGTHEAHLRELPRFQKNIWTVDMLKDHTPADFEDDEVMIINATGKGAEVLARAWCAERGKNAIIRRTGGPCFVCAVRGASQTGLKVGILIWVS